MKLHIPSVLIGFAFFLGLAMSPVPAPQIAEPLPGLTPEQEAVLALLSIVQMVDCQGGPGYDTLRVTGANFQVVNGLGILDTTNGLGNIVVGYQDNIGNFCDRNGSHNIVMGWGNSYGNYGGLVGGTNNYINGSWSTIISGTTNEIKSNSSAILSGSSNTIGVSQAVVSTHSAIVGGAWNKTTSSDCVIVGGGYNLVDGHATNINSGRWSVIVGGGGVGAINGHKLEGALSVIVGGGRNVIDDNVSSSVLVGGKENVVSGTTAVLSGGFQRSATGLLDWVAGSLFEDD